MTDKHKKMPPHVATLRAEIAAGGSRNKPLRRHKERAEHYDVFRRIDMHLGDKTVCWEWRGAHGLGTRGEFRPRVVIDKRDYYVYRVVYELYTGYKLQKGDVVRHTCDNSWCCNPYHMVIGTQRDNINDMLERERVGMKHFHVKRIMQMLEIGASAEYVAEKMKQGYNMTLDVSVIRKIRMRTIYKHIDWPWGDKYADQRRKRLDTIRKQRVASVPNHAIIEDNQKGATTHAKDKEDDQ